MPTIRLPQLLTERQVASHLNISVPWLQRQRWLRSGPPFVRCGRAVRYDIEAVQTWLQTQTVQPLSSEAGQ